MDVSLQDGLSPEQVDRWVQSACVLCSNGCGCDIAVKDGRIVGVRGREADRVNHGRLGPKGLYGWQANNSTDRLTRPLVREGGELVETDWDTALDRLVRRTKEVLADRGPQAIAFYNSGQLFLEDYYALGLLAHGGIGTPHVDGNTRLCTATAAQALKESFGCDGQPASYEDVDLTQALFLYGHNVAETQTVLWTRMRDRLEGSDPPALVVVDPRPTVPALRADVHLTPRNGTNLALMNALVHEVLENGWYDEGWVAAHAVGLDKLVEKTASCTPAWAAEICDVDPGLIREAARVFGTASSVLSTVLQGFYQSHLATASACQVNNLHLLRGLIGRPGSGVLQMNGQPTAQNTRETGANGDLAGFRNWQNEEHVSELARLWGVAPEKIPHTGPPTHAMEIFRYAELGTVNLLWVVATNPAVSMPQLSRIRRILQQKSLFLVVQDAFLTETARMADVVLPAALWGEKTGTFTNADRTVHLSEKAVDPPGEARTDLDVFLDVGRRLELTRDDGSPLLPWQTPEEVFDAWRECSRGRPCDYSGLSYETLRGGSGLQWPVTEHAPEGTARLYSDGVFPTDPAVCEDYGHDLSSGGTFTREEHAGFAEPGKAVLKTAEWAPPPEEPSEDFPLLLTTGRTVYQFHTRTKTGRAPELQQAAPHPWVEVSPEDAAKLGIEDGALVEVASPRAAVRVRARLNGIRKGVVFLPFHYGRWRGGEDFDEDSHAANELTITAWDPVSHQPYFKVGAVRVSLVEQDGEPSPAPRVGAPANAREG